MPRQGAQALDPAAAHRGRRPGRPAEGARLPEEPGQQLPLLEVEKEVGSWSVSGGGRSEMALLLGVPWGSWAPQVAGGSGCWVLDKGSSILLQFTSEILPQSSPTSFTAKGPPLTMTSAY